MPRRVTRALIAATVIGVLALTACSTPASPGTGSGDAGTPTKGGELVVGLDRELPSLDPLAGTISAAPALMLAEALYPPLMIAGEAGTVAPGLAESFTPDDTAKTWTLKIPADLTFSDGSPLTTESIQAHVKRLSDPANGSSAAGQARQIAGMEIVDDTTMVFTLAIANADFASLFQRSLGMIASTTAKDAFGFPLGAGPYVVDDFVAGDSVTVARNEKYWGKPANLDTIVFKMMPDADSRFQSLQSGDLGIMVSETANQFKQAREDDKLAVHAGAISVTSLLLNLTSPKFQDPEIRRALAQAIDRDALNAVVNLGEGKPVDSPYSLLGESAPTVDYPKYDPKAAEKVLKDADLSFTLTVSSLPSALQRATALKDMFAKVGVDVTIAPVDAASFTGVMASKQFEAADFVTSIFSDASGAALVFSTGAPYNLTGYSNKSVDAGLAAIASETDPAERAKSYEDVSAILAEDLPALWMTASNFGYISSADLVGVRDMTGLTFISIDPAEIGWAGK
ncbi:peptide/nickel transport system substrate-binding protein [Microbacterium natoriense]|uniref:Peptide/nickel transport system substrate-binding protein n=1 Tax=Microbacterium natoriense TaxID=284570 RepID=A0AAW8EXW0_9MICO|nr:ABC transporter substrate-binding protein [Microbacterium natoriense]MDQ0647041.1 peptide/nickel transport system substrate-binding protein [Microbacterium natoriense]